jgi:hypothetical protein
MDTKQEKKIPPKTEAAVPLQDHDNMREGILICYERGVCIDFVPDVNEDGDVQQNWRTGRDKLVPKYPEKASLFGALGQKESWSIELAETFEDIVDITNATIWQAHTMQHDKDGNPVQVKQRRLNRGDGTWNTREFNQRVGHHLVLSFGKTEDRDRCYNLINKELPDFLEDDGIMKGEDAFDIIRDDVKNGDQVCADLMTRVTCPRAGGKYKPSSPERLLFLDARSSRNGIYVNRQRVDVTQPPKPVGQGTAVQIQATGEKRDTLGKE